MKQVFSKDWAEVSANHKKSEDYLGEKTKISRLASFLLRGYAITGMMMIEKFNIYSYRDAIYKLKGKGLTFKSKVVTKNGIEHTVWWLDCYSEDFVKWRNPTIF